MKFPRHTLAGMLIFSGSALFLLGMILAEALASRYSVRQAISDLGVGPTAPVFSTSIIIFGLFMIAGSLLLWQEGTSRPFCLLVGLAGCGAVGTGLFPETLGAVHVAAAFTAFFCGGISALYSVRVFSAPWCWFSALLGAFSLIALALLAAGIFPGIGFGGIERMAACPLIIWALGSGGYLMAGPAGNTGRF